MDSLPVEVYTMIFSFLVQRDQLECMTVCQKWHDIILHRSLFSVITVDCQEQLDQLTERIKQNPILGTKVERLALMLTSVSTFDQTVLSDNFPNLRVFSFLGLAVVRRDTGSSLPRQSHPWHEHLESVTVITPDRNIEPLLKSGSFKNLRSLAVRGPQAVRGRGLIEALRNAPILETLFLFHYFISLQDLELLHVSLPSLRILGLVSNTFDCTSFPHDIKAAVSVKSFQSSSSRFNNTEGHNLFSKYISQKYTQLETAHLEINAIHQGNQEMIGVAAENKAIMNSHLKALGSQLKNLKIAYLTNRPDFTDRFDFSVLDQYGCQIKKLTLESMLISSVLVKLSETIQVKHMQSLIINRKAYGDSFLFSFEWLKFFTALKELSLHFPAPASQFSIKHVLRLTDLFGDSVENKLETLRLFDVRLEPGDMNINLVHPFLKNLTLSKVDSETGIHTCISQFFPNLKKLKLSDCLRSGESLMLPNANLHRLEITNKSVTGDFPILVTTLSNNQELLYYTRTKFYFFRSHLIEKYSFPPPYVSSRPFDISKDIPSLTVVCNSVYDFVMVNSEH